MNLEKIKENVRQLSFKSQKDGELKIVYSDACVRFAQILDSDGAVAFYKTAVPLNNWRDYISLTGIRTILRRCEWTSDFVVTRTDGSIEVYELISREKLNSRITVEKLEISRRYWKVKNVYKWQIVIEEDVK